MVKTLKWVMVVDKTLRFHEDTTALDISDAVPVANYSGLVKGDKVEVTIEKNVITSIHKVEAKQEIKEPELPKPEVKEEEKPSDSTKQLLTVAKIYDKTRGILFVEEKDKWYSLAKFIDMKVMKENGVVVGAKVTIATEKGEKETYNDVVVAINTIQVEEKQKETPKNDYEKEPGYNPPPQVESKPENPTPPPPEVKSEKDAFYRIKQLENQVRFLQEEKTKSIEIQGSVDRAFNLVGKSLQGQDPDLLIKNMDTIKKTIRELAEYSFKTVQELKGK